MVEQLSAEREEDDLEQLWEDGLLILLSKRLSFFEAETLARFEEVDFEWRCFLKKVRAENA